MDKRILKVHGVPKGDRDDGLPKHPFNFLPYAPPCDCVFDTYHCTIGIDIYPFAVTTRVDASNQIFLKVYEEDSDKCNG